MNIQAKLGRAMRAWRAMNERTLEDLSRETGLDKATLSRAEAGKPISGETLSRLLAWLLGWPLPPAGRQGAPGAPRQK